MCFSTVEFWTPSMPGPSFVHCVGVNPVLNKKKTIPSFMDSPASRGGMQPGPSNHASQKYAKKFKEIQPEKKLEWNRPLLLKIKKNPRQNISCKKTKENANKFQTYDWALELCPDPKLWFMEGVYVGCALPPASRSGPTQGGTPPKRSVWVSGPPHTMHVFAQFYAIF